MSHNMHRLWMALATAGAIVGSATVVVAGPKDDTLNIGMLRETDYLDRLHANARETQLLSALLYDTLIYGDPQTREFKPGLATAWTQVDPTTIDFDLRQGVKFHNGEAFNADDVVYTIKTVMDPATKLLQQAADFGNYASVEKLGDYKVRLKLKEPDPTVLNLVASRLIIFPNEYSDKNGHEAHRAAPVGTGPYALKSLQAGKSYVFARYPGYVPAGRPAASIANLNFRVIPQVQTQLAEFMIGGLDLSFDFDADSAKMAASTPNVKVSFGGSTRYTYLSLDAAGRSGDTPLKNAAVRRAIGMAIDRKAIADQLVGNGAPVLRAHCNPNQTLCLDEELGAPAYDPAKARELLKAAGYPDGFKVAFESSEDLRSLGEAVQGYLGKVGIKADYSTATLPAWRTRFLAGNSSMSLMGWGGGGGLDVDYALATFFNGSATDYARDPEVTKLVGEGRSTLDPEARKGVYRKLLGLINERAYSVPLFGNVSIYVMGSNLNFLPPKIDSPDLTWAKWAN